MSAVLSLHTEAKIQWQWLSIYLNGLFTPLKVQPHFYQLKQVHKFGSLPQSPAYNGSLENKCVSPLKKLQIHKTWTGIIKRKIIVGSLCTWINSERLPLHEIFWNFCNTDFPFLGQPSRSWTLLQTLKVYKTWVRLLKWNKTIWLAWKCVF